MYDETKFALRKALEIGKTLFSLGGERYSILIDAVEKIRPPTRDDLSIRLEGGASLEDAIIAEMRDRYAHAAVAAGFEERHGFAMLEYAALLEELNNG
jgi:hypothetical protein